MVELFGPILRVMARIDSSNSSSSPLLRVIISLPTSSQEIDCNVLVSEALISESNLGEMVMCLSI